MNQDLHKHDFIKDEFIPSLYTCSSCGCINYQEKTTFKAIKSKADLSAFTSFFTTFTSQQNMYWTYHDIERASAYICKRMQGITQIRSIANHYSIEESTIHAAIYLMDYVFIKLKCEKDIIPMSLICLILIVKYYTTAILARKLEQDLYSAKLNLYDKEDEIELLKLLNYDLFFVTAYDTLSFFLQNGIIFDEELESCTCPDKLESLCKMQLNILIERNDFVNYLPFQMAFTIMSLVREISNVSFRSKLLEELYGYDIYYYADCYNDMKQNMKIKQDKDYSISNQRKKMIKHSNVSKATLMQI